VSVISITYTSVTIFSWWKGAGSQSRYRTRQKQFMPWHRYHKKVYITFINYKQIMKSLQTFITFIMHWFMFLVSRYIAILDFPLIVDSNRLLRRGQWVSSAHIWLWWWDITESLSVNYFHVIPCRLIKFDKEKYARIGIMPLYGDANSIKWFEVEPNCTFHLINSFEDGHDEVVTYP